MKNVETPEEFDIIEDNNESFRRGGSTLNSVEIWISKLNSWLHSLSLKRRLIFYFLILMVASYLAMGILLNSSITRQMDGVYTNFTQQTISQAMLDLEGRMQSTDRSMSLILSDRSVQNYLKTGDSVSESQVRTLLENVRGFSPEILGIALVNRQGKLLSNEMYQPEKPSGAGSPGYLQLGYPGKGIHFISRPYGRNLTYFNSVSADRILSLVRTIPGADGDSLGVLSIDLDVEVIKERLEKFKLGKEGFVYVLDPDGNVAYAPDSSVVPRIKRAWFIEHAGGTFNRTIQGKLYQIIYETSQYTGFVVVGVFPANETLMAVHEFRIYFLGITFLVLFLSVFGAQRISDTVVRPLDKLKELMARAEQGDLTVSFNPQYDDEIGKLGIRFDRMIGEIRNLIEQVRKEQGQKRKAELQVLQAQINPHFLYNTFDTIHWMLKKYGATDVIEVISRLTDLFRISLSGGADVIPLGEECRHVEAYLTIQKVRYEDQLNFEILVPEGLCRCPVHKLILQPLVENAIYHGVKNRDSGGLIQVEALLCDGDLLLVVTDNGPGIEAGQLEDIRRRLDSMERPEAIGRKGYGLFNVHERIRLACGNPYGISVESAQGNGCRVEIRYPILPVESGEAMEC